MPKKPEILTILSILIATLAFFACIAAFIPGFTGQSAVESVISVRGEPVILEGSGLYRHDSVSVAAQGRAQDLVTLLIGIPLLILSLIKANEGLLRFRLLLAGTLAYFTYTYASYSFLSQYNHLFLVYVALLSLSVIGLFYAIKKVDMDLLKSTFSGPRVRLGVIIFDFAAGIMIFLMWMGRILPGLLGKPDQSHLEHYTTLVIQALDLAFIVPLALISGYQLYKNRPAGYLLSGIFLLKGLSLGLALAAMIIFEALAGVQINLIEVFIFALIIAAGLSLAILFLGALRPTEEAIKKKAS